MSWGQTGPFETGNVEECAFWKSLEFTTKNHTSRTPSFRGLRTREGRVSGLQRAAALTRTVSARARASGLWSSERPPPPPPAGAPVKSPSTFMNPLTRGCYWLLNFKIFRFTPFDPSPPRPRAANTPLSLYTLLFLLLRLHACRDRKWESSSGFSPSAQSP